MTRRVLWLASGCLLIAGGSALFWVHRHTSRFDEEIAGAAARNGVDFFLVKAVVFEESWFQPHIRGPAGEFGLMQVTAGAAADFASSKGMPPIQESRLLEPELNLEVGCWYLRKSLEHFQDSPEPVLLALLRYNAGETRADQWHRAALASPVPPGGSREAHYLSIVDFPKTRAYVRRILRRNRSRGFWF